MTTDTPSKNAELLADFTVYCKAHPSERFWQALRNWSGENFVYVSEVVTDDLALRDTFYINTRTCR